MKFTSDLAALSDDGALVMRHWRRALAVAAGAFASFAAYRAAPAAAPTSAALAADERVRSAMASSCSDTCRALGTGPRCIARCKKAKSKK